MTPNEYQKAALRTVMSNAEQACKIIEALEKSPSISQLIVAGAKLSSESGEVNDAIVKHISYGQPLDYDNIVEECGDLLWYIAIILENCSTTIEDAMIKNIEKLKLRYPTDSFSEKDALERKDKIVQSCRMCGGDLTKCECVTHPYVCDICSGEHSTDNCPAVK